VVVQEIGLDAANQVGCVTRDPAMARAGSTEAVNDVVATVVRADEGVAMDAEGTLVG
jgi:hypothetical protein